MRNAKRTLTLPLGTGKVRITGSYYSGFSGSNTQPPEGPSFGIGEAAFIDASGRECNLWDLPLGILAEDFEEELERMALAQIREEIENELLAWQDREREL
jgi:hypothetical protein